MQLNFRTRGKDVSPQGKPRVYFCCHPEDLSVYFDSVSQEILNLENCAVFYDESPNTFCSKTEWESRLADMQLFVMPVTSKLLMSANKGLDEYKIALKCHIPVLPLMQEEGLAQLFNEVCGNLQFLDKHQKDETAISYQQKLKNFLDGVLVGDEQANAVRAAFRSYIFLSYRKKDRAHAQRLMKLVHKCELCRDVAIWYDEYLVPGEDFNNAIGEALNKSQMFLLAVTPNLVCESNYVQTVEYPMALQNGKTILPVEMSSTDKNLLASQYVDLPAVINESDESAVMQQLANFFPRKDNLMDDLPRYHLIALAYLDGIDVEVDHARAFEMLTYCAERNNIESIKMLADMYKRGKGVERDISKAIQWQARLVAMLEPKAQNADKNTKLDFLVELINLAALYKELLQYDNAIQVYHQFKEFSEQWMQTQQYEPLAKSMLALAFNEIGNVYRTMYNFDKALESFKWALHYAEQLVVQEQSEQNYKDLVMCYGNLSRCYEDSKDYEMALQYSEARLAILNIIAEMSKDGDYLFSLMQCYSDIFDICKATYQVEKARQAITKAVETAERIDDEQNDAESKDWLLLAYSRMAALCYMEENFEGERDWYLKSLNISIQLVDQYASLDARQTLAELLQNLADNASILANHEEAEDYICKALYLRETIAEEVTIPQTKFDLALACSSAATLYDKIYQTDKAIQLLQRAEKLLLELVGSNNAVRFRSALADCYYWMGIVYTRTSDNSRCVLSYEKGLKIMLELYDELKDDHTLTQVAPFYYTLANHYAESDANKALEYYLKVFEIDLDYAQKHDSIDKWRQCVVDLTDLGNHYHKNMDDDESATKCFENALDIAKDLLTKTNSSKVHNSYATLLDSMASFYEDNEDLHKAIQYSEQALEVYKDLAHQFPTADQYGCLFSELFLLGQFYNMVGQLQKAKQANIQALELLLEHKDDFMSIGYIDDTTVVELCSTIGDNCLDLQQLDQGLDYYKKALAYAEDEVQSAEKQTICKVLRNISHAYDLQQNYSEQLQFALQAVGESLALAQQQENSTTLIDCAKDCKSLATCYENLQDYQNALEYYSIAKTLSEQVRNDNLPSNDGFGLFTYFYMESSRLLAELNFHIGDHYYRENNIDKTIEYLAPAIEVALDLANSTDERKDWMLLASYCYYLGSFAGIEPLQKAEEVLKMLLDEDPTDNVCSQMLQCVRDAMRKY